MLVIFFDRTFLKTIITSRIPKAFGSTFGFAPTTLADTEIKPKEPFFCQRTDNNSYFVQMNLNN